MQVAEQFVFITGTPANLRQGSGTYAGIAALQRALGRLGHEVELIAPARASPSFWRRLAFNWRARGQSGDAFIVGFDLDGLFSPGSIASIKGVIAEEMQFERGATWLRLWAESRLERWRVRRAALVLTTSRYAANALERRYGVGPGRIRIVPELLDVAAWQRDLAAAPALPHPPRVLAVAHLYPRKDIATLLCALALLPAPIELHVAGDGPERARLERLAGQLRLGERVQFLGHIPRAALLAEYRNADLFCHPSRQEGFGIVLLEAMASGLPIVAARAAAIPEVVPEPEGGVLFPPGDAPALAAALRRLLDNDVQRQSMARAARRHVLRYDAVRVAREFLDAIT